MAMGQAGYIRAFESAISIRNSGEKIRKSDQMRYKNILITMVGAKDRNDKRSYYPGIWDALLDKFGADELIKVFTWSYPSGEEPNETGWWYVRGRLLEEAGDEPGAIKLYRELISRFPSDVNVHSKLAKERIREIEVKMDICYVPMLVVNYFAGGAQADVKVLKKGDILLSYNGESIRDLEGLDRAKQSVDTEHVDMVFLRDGAPLELKVLPGKLGIDLDETSVSERELGEYAGVLCGRGQSDPPQ